MNLLLIDGDKSFLEGLSTELQKKDVCILTAASAMTALRLLSENKVDLILSGCDIPGSQVLLFVCNVKGRYPHTPLILLSGLQPAFNINTALLLGVNELVPRNTNVNQLYSAITKYSA